MKQKLFIAAILLFTFSFAKAQSFHMGIKAGATINKLTGKSFTDEFSFGYQAGAFAEIGLNKKIAIHPEVLFGQTNIDTASKFNQLYSNIQNIKLSYLTIPILFNYKPIKVLTLQAGPQVGILIDKNKNIIQNGKEAFKTGDFGLLGGIQLNLSSFKIYARYTIGLNNLNDIDKQDKWRSQSIQAGIGWKLF